MQRLKAWWSTLVWWKKVLLILPVSVTFLALLLVSLWPRNRTSPVAIAPVDSTSTARQVEVKVDAIVNQINEEITESRKRAQNVKEEIQNADSFDAVDDALRRR